MTAASVSLHTFRLVLRRFQDGDLEPFLAYRNHPEVARFQSWVEWTREQGIDFIRDQKRVEPGDFGRWFQLAMVDRASGELIGDCGICLKVEIPRTAEIGFSVAPKHQRRGFGREAVSRLLVHAFEDLSVDRVIATVIQDNERSASLLHGLGFGHGPPERVWFKDRWCEELRFSLDRSAWTVRSAAS